MTATLLAATDPALRDACGADPGAACRFVFDHTSSSVLADVADFLVTRPLKIALICAAAWLLTKLTRRLIRRSTSRLAGSADSGRLSRARQHVPNILVTEQQPSLRSAARAETIGQVLRSASTVVIWTLAVFYIVAELGLQLGPLIAGAGVAGVAIGFGAQSLVKDFLSGMFMLVEDQYGVGDVIDCGEATGTVEAVSLRTTRLRDVNGTVWHVPNGEIRRVGNKSQQWARALLDILVTTGTDVERAQDLLMEVATRVCATDDMVNDVLEPPEVWGVENMGPEGITVRLVVKTRPGSQWKVMRALRVAIQEAFLAAGIKTPVPPGTITVTTSDPGPPPDSVAGEEQR